MQIQITGRNLEVTQAIRDYIHEKFEKLTRHFEHVIGAEVVLQIEHNRHFAEAKIAIPGNDVVAKAESEHMYGAIDALQSKLDRQLIKVKEKMKSHKSNKNNHQQSAL